ncbi:hypothetical protein D3C72_1544280 [compost metagenome]
MQGRQRALVARIHGRQHVKRFGAPALSYNNAVGPHAQRIAHKFAYGDMPPALLIGGARFQRHQMIVIQPQLGGVLNGDDPLAIGDFVGQDVQQGRFARARAAGHNQVFAHPDA